MFRHLQMQDDLEATEVLRPGPLVPCSSWQHLMGYDLMGLSRGHASHAPPTSCQVWCGSLGTHELERRTAATVWQFPNCTGFNPETCNRLSMSFYLEFRFPGDLDNHLTISFQTSVSNKCELHCTSALEIGSWKGGNSTLTFLFLSSSHGKPGTPPTHRPFSKHFRH